MTKQTYLERVERALLGPDRPQTINNLAKQLGVHASTVSLALRQLVQDGKAQKKGRGFYRVPYVRWF